MDVVPAALPPRPHGGGSIDIRFMKRPIQLCIALTCMATSCHRITDIKYYDQAPRQPVQTEDYAISLARNAVQESGDDQTLYEYTAKYIDNHWNVTANRIFYPHNTGSAKFVPGGFTIFVITTNGVITNKIHGK